MTEIKRQFGLMLLETSLQGGGIFFTPRALRLLGALGNALINSPRIKQHKPTHDQSLQKSCFFALALCAL